MVTSNLKMKLHVTWTHGTYDTLWNVYGIRFTMKLMLNSCFWPNVMEGDLKRVLVHETGLEPKEQRLLFRGKQKDDVECLHIAGVTNASKVILVEDPASKERKLEEMRRNQYILKAYEAVAKVRVDVDNLSEKVMIP